MYAQVRATNVYGNSGVSTPGNGAVILTNPDPPTNVIQVVATTTPTAIGLTWTQPAANGGSAVIDYRISYDQSADSYVVLASGVTATIFVATSLVTGNTYKFKV